MDYQKLGFKAGIEIHQELNTKKLFCDCASLMEEKEVISTTRRKLRASAGETGRIDLASAFEHMRDRSFVYHGYKNESCLVDLDEEPPHNVNPEAFEIALGVAKLFKLRVPDSICVMRKTVTDGSSVAGFQRTMLIGLESDDSYLETSKGKVKITQLNLEEDACKIQKKENNAVYYSLSRQGIPLLEIGTDASIKDPEHVKETALMIGTILRSFNVKRGIGTIRQDVNISIRDGARIEVKGWQDLKKLEELVDNEVLRQYNLIQIKKELEGHDLKKFDKIAKDVTSLCMNSENKILSEQIKNNAVVYALIVPKFSGLLKKELCPGKTFGSELADYARAYGTKGMIHSDEDLTKYNLVHEFNELRKNPEDLVVVIAEKKDIAEKAVNSVYERALYCLKGVPEETRIPNHIDATSSYARPLPGAHRLYPETDIPNIQVNKKILAQAKLPELVPHKIERFARTYGIGKDIAKELVNEGFEFENYVKDYRNIEPRFIAHTLVEIPKEIKKRYNKEIEIENYSRELFDKLNNNDISKDAVFEILVEHALGKQVDYSKYKPMTQHELEQEVKKIISENKGLPINAIIGKVMEKLRGRAEGKKIVEIVKSLIS